MLALSIQQPWASLIVAGIKDIENRNWPTEHRGHFIIHASELFDERFNKSPINFLDQVNDKYGLELDLSEVLDMPHGGIVGQAEIIDCVTASESIWFEGKYGFVIRNAMPLNFCPCMGLPRFFDVIPPLEASISRIRHRLLHKQQGAKRHDLDTAYRRL
jgi:hypothetical protein